MGVPLGLSTLFTFLFACHASRLKGWCQALVYVVVPPVLDIGGCLGVLVTGGL